MSQNRVAAFLTVLRESQLLEPEQVEELAQSSEAKASDLNGLAKIILQKGWLTRFQLTTVSQGKTRDLQLGPYRLIDRLGEGGMGQVFKAYHQPMNRMVALKVIRKEKLASPTAVQRFFREVQAAARLVHPNIVVAFDANQESGTHYFAMEYVDGIDLAKLVKQNGPLPVPVACDYIRQAALGLQHAHEQGMVHRDIKPHNLLVAQVTDNSASRAGSMSSSQLGQKAVVKILDMGLARLSTPGSGDQTLTQDGAVIGTPEYIPPEQALNARSADIRSDLYSLGCTFYFLLTGRPPFQSGTLTEMLLKHQMETPTPVTTLRPEIPPALAEVVHCLLAKRPEDRFPTPVELIQALTAASQGIGPGAPVSFPVQSPGNDWSDVTAASVERAGSKERSPSLGGETTASGRGRTASRREIPNAHRKKLLWVGASGLVAVVLVVAGVIAWLPGRNANQPVAAATGQAPGSTPVAIAQSPAPPTPPGLPTPPDSGSKPQPPPNSQLQSPPPPPRPMPPDPKPLPSPALPPVLKEAWHQISPLPLNRLSISPDGKQAVTCTASESVTIWDLEKIQLAQIAKVSSSEVYAVAATPDRRRVLVGLASGIGIVDVASGKVVQQIRGDMASTPSGIAVSPDGRRAVVSGGSSSGSADCYVRVFDLNTGQQLNRCDQLGGRVRLFVLSDDGLRALFMAGNKLGVWDIYKGPKVRMLTPTPSHFDLTPDGKQALIIEAGNVLLWDVDADRQLLEIAKMVRANRVAVSPDGRLGLVNRLSDNILQVVNLATGETVATLDTPPGSFRDFAFRGDSQNVLAVGSDKIMRAWKLKPLPSVAAPAPLPMDEAERRNRLVKQLTASKWVHEGRHVYKFEPDGTYVLEGTKFHGTYDFFKNGTKITLLWEHEQRAEVVEALGAPVNWKMVGRPFVPREQLPADPGAKLAPLVASGWDAVERGRMVKLLTASKWVHGGNAIYRFEASGSFSLEGTPKRGTYEFSAIAKQIVLFWENDGWADVIQGVGPPEEWKMLRRAFVPMK